MRNAGVQEAQAGVKIVGRNTNKAFDCIDHNKLVNSERDGNNRPLYLPPEKPVCRSKSNSQNWTWKKGLVPDWERIMSRLYIVTLLI